MTLKVKNRMRHFLSFFKHCALLHMSRKRHKQNHRELQELKKMFLLIFVLTKNMTVCFIFIRVAIDEKYFMREGKKRGKIASQLFNDKLLQKEFCLEKRFLTTHFQVHR